jgi:hypothetical protein
MLTSSWWRAESISGRLASSAAVSTVASSTRSRRSSTLPRVMREISSRSSTSRTRWRSWRSMISTPCSTFASANEVRRRTWSALRIGAQRIAQLVGEDGQELVLAPVVGAQLDLRLLEAGDVLADLVLPLPGSQRGPRGAHERGLARGPLEHGHVAQHVHRARHQRGARAGERQHEHGQVRPRRLRREPLGDAVRPVLRHGLLREQHGRRAAREFGAQLVHVPAGPRLDARAAEDADRQVAIAPERSQHEHALLGAGHPLRHEAFPSPPPLSAQVRARRLRDGRAREDPAEAAQHGARR